MATTGKHKRKVFFTVGGRGLSPDVDVKKVGITKFNKRTCNRIAKINK